MSKDGQELALAVLGVVPVASQLAALVSRCQVAQQRVDDRQLGSAEALLRARREHDGTEQSPPDDERADNGAGETELAKHRRPRIRIARQRLEDVCPALRTLKVRSDDGDTRARQRRTR